MLFCKLDENGNAVSYRVTWDNIKLLKPKTSIPYPPTKEILDELGFGVYVETERPVCGPLEKPMEVLPVKNGDVYEQTWQIVPRDPQEIEIITRQHWNMLRSYRNQLLLISDKYMLEDIKETLTAEQIQAWKTYRQVLRDFPSTITDPFNVTWPTKPE